MCKHQWQPLIPDASQVEDMAGYYVETTLQGGILNRSVYCPLCGKTGHRINSRRSGIRLHSDAYFLNRANTIRAKYNLPFLAPTPS